MSKRSSDVILPFVRQSHYSGDATLEELQLAVENSMTGISWLDTSGTFRQVRDGYASMLGYSPDELIGQSWSVTVPESDHDTGIAAVQTMLRTGRTTVETRAVRKDGSVFYKRLLLVKTTDSQGRHNGHYCFMSDVSERTEAQRRLADAERLKTIGTLAGGIAHDLNNLLTPILGRAELLSRGAGADEGAVDDIRNAALRAQELIDRLLKFSKNEREELKPLSLIGAVRVALQFVTGSLPANVSLQTRFEASADVVCGLEAPLELIVLNLVSNAGYVMRDGGGELVVSLSNPDAQHIELAITDTGPGIPSQTLERIFDPFYTTKPPAEGTGLGLLMVKEAVDEMNGRLDVDSVEQQGTTFRITFPLCNEPSNEDCAIELQHGPRLRVLVVDDEQSVLDICQTMLEHLGHDVVAFTDPHAAANSPLDDIDLVISDYRMGGVSGIEFVRELAGYRGPVILMSGALDDSESLPDNVSGILSKPFQLQSLQDAVLMASSTNDD